MTSTRRTSLLWTVGLLLAVSLTWLAVRDTDARTLSLLSNTLRLAAGTVLVAVPLGVLAAILIHRTDMWGRRTAWSALVAWLFVPLYLQAAGWDAWFGRQGWLLPAQDTDAWRMTAAIWIHAAAAVPWVAIIVGAALMQVAPELEEAASLEMSAMGVLARITLPLCWPAILISCWWAFIQVTGEMTVTDLYQVRTFAEEIYTTVPLLEPHAEGVLGEAALPRGTWNLVGCVLISLVLFGFVARHDFPSPRRTRIQLALGYGRIPGTLAMAAIVLTIMAIPLINLCVDAGLQVQRSGNEIVQIWSWQKLGEIILRSPWTFRREFGWSALIAACAALLATAIAAPLAWGARRRTFASLPALIVTSVSAAVPGPIIALAIIRWLNREESTICVWLYDRTILAPVLAAAVRALPVAILVSWWGFRTVPQELVDMARLDGLGFVGCLRHVAWPLRRELFLAAWCAALAVAAGDLAASLLVTPPGVSTLSMRIFGLLHAGVDDQVAGICLTNVFVCVGLALVTRRLIQRLSVSS